jgi:hypothetical protein
MILHRAVTCIHTIARIPFWRGRPYNTKWAFSDRDIDQNLSEDSVDQADQLARQEVEQINNRLMRRYQRRIQERYVSVLALNDGNDERQPLIAGSRSRQGSFVRRNVENRTAALV